MRRTHARYSFQRPVPRRSVIFLSGFAHLAALVLISRCSMTGPHVVPEKIQTVQKLSGTDHLAFHPAEAKAGQPDAAPLHSTSENTAHTCYEAEDRRGRHGFRRSCSEHAKAAIAGMVANIKVASFTASSTEQYDLAFRPGNASCDFSRRPRRVLSKRTSPWKLPSTWMAGWLTRGSWAEKRLPAFSNGCSRRSANSNTLLPGAMARPFQRSWILSCIFRVDLQTQPHNQVVYKANRNCFVRMP